jgi:superfamily II DNA helicase RecQ
MLDYTFMDTHDKQLLLKIGDMVEDCQRRLTLIEELIRSGGGKRASDAPDKEAKRAEKQAIIDALSAEDRALYDALREWRGSVARGLGWSPMTVAHDRTLLDLVAVRPDNNLAFLAVNSNLATKYGPELLALIKRYPRSEADAPW